MPADRAEHNARQAALFDSKVALFEEELPAQVQASLRHIVAAVPALGPDSRVIDVGAGTGCLVPFLRERGVRDILAVDLSPKMLAALEARYGEPSTLGNDLGAHSKQLFGQAAKPATRGGTSGPKQ